MNPKDYVHKMWSESIGGVKRFLQFPYTPNTLPEQDYQVANKLYVDKEYISAASITLNNGVSAQTVTDLQTRLDGNTYDIQEFAGIPGIDLGVTFNNVSKINSVVVVAYYVGSATHSVRVQLYNYDTTNWDTFDTIPTGLDHEEHIGSVVDDTNYINQNTAIVRLYHTESGNASHDMYIDYVALRGFGT